MNPRHRVSRAAIELIARFEGYRRKAAQLSDGRWTIGYGHTLTAREGAEVSADDAEALLLYDLIAVSHGLNEWVYAPLNQNQFDALASFAFNIGLENFRRSTVLKRINEGALIQAACAMELWRKAEFGGERIIIDALVRRRAAEKVLFLTPPEGWPAAPTPVLKPLLDFDADGLVPRQAPAPVTASLEGQQVRVLRGDEPIPPPSPPEEPSGPSPVQAAAEAVASRLRTIFPEPEAPAKAQTQEPAAAQPTAVSEPEFPPIPEAIAAEAEPEPGAQEEAEGPQSDDLFDRPAAANDLAEQPASNGARLLIDDTAPFEFIAPIVQPLPAQPKGGPLSVAALAVLGLAFFAGGVFWAFNAVPSVADGILSPRLVGWLAGLSGVGLFSVAVFLLLQRMGRPGRD